ncbi:hypothetical protein CEXT_493031 [Caerostris extrusa]|uniref:Uncharacterized protein n=1 Tax=Caerostris extrusa TaxID=172846 RepID=A0AAV4T7W2_CAEEX|nr:hypothetical protein CEXT_493031 [Caerostris extrusa]
MDKKRQFTPLGGAVLLKECWREISTFFIFIRIVVVLRRACNVLRTMSRDYVFEGESSDNGEECVEKRNLRRPPDARHGRLPNNNEEFSKTGVNDIASIKRD